ncbi:hypothetical protein [Companilactobacillus zhachilii]|uniref:hypothetical protein n=1 Tax=Companilactobacillus zhachilii TaxID=2304606 RepID=UPI004034F152
MKKQNDDKMGSVSCRLWVQKMLALWGPTKAKVLRLDFELRKVREFQNSSRGVMAEAITPPALLPAFLAPRD